MTREEKKKLEKELSELYESISDLEKRIGRLDRELGPVWEAEDQIKARIIASHGKDARGIIALNPASFKGREALYEGLLGIAIKHGPVKSERSELAQRSRAYQRRARNIEKELKHKKLTPDKPRSQQGRLF